MRSRLKLIVPDLSVVCLHGRLPVDEIDDRMMSFVEGKADVLLATNIVDGRERPSRRLRQDGPDVVSGHDDAPTGYDGHHPGPKLRLRPRDDQKRLQPTLKPVDQHDGVRNPVRRSVPPPIRSSGTQW